MRLNDKSLAKFASSGSRPDKQGYLNKKGEVHKSFQKRFFVLKGNLLFYFEKHGDKEPIGVIILEGYTIELAENTDNFTFQIIFPGSHSRVYTLSADTQEVMEAWMRALSRASYDYLKAMVADLQQQLAEIKDEEKTLLCQGAQEDTVRISKLYKTEELVATSLLDDSHLDSVSRVNPFNIVDREKSPLNFKFDAPDFSNKSLNSTPECKHKSFIEMHQVYGEQIKRLSDEWKQRSDKCKPVQNTTSDVFA